jgi:DNA-binding XRE family transcriptional regulator
MRPKTGAPEFRCSFENLTSGNSLRTEKSLGVHTFFDSLVNMKRRSSSKLRWKDGGRWLRQLRLNADLSQAELAKQLGLKRYSYVSQIETGVSRLPLDRVELWAQKLKAEPSQFAEQVISFYEPTLHRLLRGQKDQS